MIDSDYDLIESSLGLAVPVAYRRVMAAYPFHNDRPSEAFIPDNATYICDLNRHVRSDSDSFGVWRPEHFVIGTSYGGDPYFIDTSIADSPVFECSRDDHVVSTLARTLDEWVRQLIHWYVEFHRDKVADEYRDVVAAIQTAGYFCTSPEPMGGWHRVCVSSCKGGGKSFWIAVQNDTRFVGTWSDKIYRIPSGVAECCIACLAETSGTLHLDFSEAVKAEYGLQAVPAAELEQSAGTDS